MRLATKSDTLKRDMMNRRHLPRFDLLDDRCLLSSGLSATLSGGVLTVVGTDAADRIVLNVQGPRRARPGIPAVSGVVNVGGIGSFPADQITRINILGGAGDDRIVVNEQTARLIPTAIAGGDGNDLIFGGPESDLIWGNQGDDRIFGRGGGDQIDGGPGLNRINGVIVGAATTSPIPTAPAPPSVSSPPSPTPVSSPSPPPSSSATNPPFIVVYHPPADLVNPTVWAQQIIDLTNQQRQQNGLSPLQLNAELTKIAQIQAQQMASLNQLAHDLSGAPYPTMRDRAAAAGYQFSWLGENIAYNYPSPQSTVDAFMQSASHRANMLDPKYTQIGAAVAENSMGQPYVALEFGTPA